MKVNLTDILLLFFFTDTVSAAARRAGLVVVRLVDDVCGGDTAASRKRLLNIELVIRENFVPAVVASSRFRRQPLCIFFLIEFIKCHVGCFAQRAFCFEISAAPTLDARSVLPFQYPSSSSP